MQHVYFFLNCMILKKALRWAVTPVIIDQTTRRNICEALNLQKHPCKNLKVLQNWLWQTSETVLQFAVDLILVLGNRILTAVLPNLFEGCAASSRKWLLNFCDYKCKWDLHSSGILRSIDWWLPTFGDNLAGASSAVKQLSIAWPLKTSPIGSPETSVTNYQLTQRNIPEERKSPVSFPCVIILHQGVTAWTLSQPIRFLDLPVWTFQIEVLENTANVNLITGDRREVILSWANIGKLISEYKVF
jgi:hypothetical protein